MSSSFDDDDHQSSQCVWFVLVDSKGKPVQQMQQHHVRLARGGRTTRIGDFLVAVKNSLKDALQGVDVNNLRVFESIASLGNGKPFLKPWSTLNDLGKDEGDNALVVMVPDFFKYLPSYGLLFQPFCTDASNGMFQPCTDAFFTQFPMTDEHNGRLTFTSLNSLTNTQQLFIRSAYITIADAAMSLQEPTDPLLSEGNRNYAKYALVTGTPGVGKSVFLHYVFWRLVKKRKRVLFLSEVPIIYFDGTTVQFCTKLPLPQNTDFWTPDLWCLVDSMDPTHISGLPLHASSVFLASMPRSDHTSQFSRLVQRAQLFYLPLWTRCELEEIAPLYRNAKDVWINRFEHLGGVPRFVVESIHKEPNALLREACMQCSLENCISVVTLNTGFTAKSLLVQKLVHLHSVPPYTTFQEQFASKSAMNAIAYVHGIAALKNMETLIGSSAENSITAAFCGHIFESYAIRKLEKGGAFEYRNLFGKNKTKIIKIKSKGPRQLVKTVEKGQAKNQLFVPRSRSVPGDIDAWIPNVGGFQIVLSNSYSNNAGAPSVLTNLHGNGVKNLFFVVPPFYFSSFSAEQANPPMNQFVLCIPYPKEITFDDMCTTNQDEV